MAVLVLIGIAYYVKRLQTEKDNMAQEKAMMEKKAMEQKEAMMEKKDESMMKKEESDAMDKGDTMMTYSGAVLAGTSALLLDFQKLQHLD